MRSFKCLPVHSGHVTSGFHVSATSVISKRANDIGIKTCARIQCII